MANAVAETKRTAPESKKNFSLVLTEKLDGISTALPKEFNKARFVQNALSLLNEKPELAKYGQTQILAGLTRGALLGLDFFNKEAYLVAYGNQLQYQTSYIGAQKLVKKYAIKPVKNIYAELVREGDLFESGIEKNQKYVTFKPNPFSNLPVIGAFAVCEFENGDIAVETMNMEELEAVRKKSKMGNAGAWKEFTGEMQKKTVIRRLCKKIEIDFENPEQKQIFEADTDIETDPAEIRNNQVQESANSVDFEDVIDAKAVEVKEIPEEEMPFK